MKRLGRGENSEKGFAIPTSSKDLLSYLQAHSLQGQNRKQHLNKQDQKSEDLENRLMAIEDFMNIPSEMSRVRRLSELMKMYSFR